MTNCFSTNLLHNPKHKVIPFVSAWPFPAFVHRVRAPVELPGRGRRAGQDHFTSLLSRRNISDSTTTEPKYKAETSHVWFQLSKWVGGGGLLVTMVQKKKIDTEVLPGWWCFHVLVSFSLQSRQGLPQWILSHFRQAPPLTDHTAAFKGLNEHQRQVCDFAFLSEHYNLWSFPPDEKPSPARSHSHL